MWLYFLVCYVLQYNSPAKIRYYISFLNVICFYPRIIIYIVPSYHLRQHASDTRQVYNIYVLLSVSCRYLFRVMIIIYHVYSFRRSNGLILLCVIPLAVPQIFRILSRLASWKWSEFSLTKLWFFIICILFVCSPVLSVSTPVLYITSMQRVNTAHDHSKPRSDTTYTAHKHHGNSSMIYV